jgi:ABC-type antimicrobial peptide transport system permease subunit
MKLLSMSTLLLGIYVVMLGTYAWYERELLTVALGILPLVLLTIVRAFDRASEKAAVVATSRASVRS